MNNPIPKLRSQIPFIPFRIQWGESYFAYNRQKFASVYDLIGSEGSEILAEQGYDKAMRALFQIQVEIEDVEIIKHKQQNCEVLRERVLRNCKTLALNDLIKQLTIIDNGLATTLTNCGNDFIACKNSAGAGTQELVAGGGRYVRGTDIDNDDDRDIPTPKPPPPDSPTIFECNAIFDSCVNWARNAAEQLKRLAFDDYRLKTGQNPPIPYGNGLPTGGYCQCCSEANEAYNRCRGVTPNLIEPILPSVATIKGATPPYYPVSF